MAWIMEPSRNHRRNRLIGRQTETLPCEPANHPGKSAGLREFRDDAWGPVGFSGGRCELDGVGFDAGLSRSGHPPAKAAVHDEFQDDLTIYSDGGQRGVMIAAVGGEVDLPRTIAVDRDGTAQVSVVSDMSALVLAPGETRSEEDGYVSFESWRKAVLDRDQRVASNLGAPIRGESVLGWYAVASKVTGNDICSMIDFVNKNRSDAPLNMVLMDQGWQVGRHPREANDRFAGA